MERAPSMFIIIWSLGCLALALQANARFVQEQGGLKVRSYSLDTFVLFPDATEHDQTLCADHVPT